MADEGASDAILEAVKYWIEKEGVAGYRLDAIRHLVEGYVRLGEHARNARVAAPVPQDVQGSGECGRVHRGRGVDGRRDVRNVHRRPARHRALNSTCHTR